MAGALVEMQRISGGHAKRLGPFEIMIDDEVVGSLGPGESKAFEVAPGSHEVFAKIYWCRSMKVNLYLRQDQKVTFRCETRSTNSLTDGYWATLGRRRYLRLTRVASSGRPEAKITEDKPTSSNARRDRQPIVAACLLLLVGISLLALTWGADFLSSISAIYIGVQAVMAINFHVLTPRATPGLGDKSHKPFWFQTVREAIISATFALAGVASLTGFLNTSNLAGWLAIGAAAAGVANVIVTRRSTTPRYQKPLHP